MGRNANARTASAMRRDNRIKRMIAKLDKSIDDPRGHKILAKLITHYNNIKVDKERKHAQKVKYWKYIRSKYPVLYCVSATFVNRGGNNNAMPVDKNVGFYTTYNKAKAAIPKTSDLETFTHKLCSPIKIVCAESSKVDNKDLLHLDEAAELLQ